MDELRSVTARASKKSCAGFFQIHKGRKPKKQLIQHLVSFPRSHVIGWRTPRGSSLIMCRQHCFRVQTPVLYIMPEARSPQCHDIFPALQGSSSVPSSHRCEFTSEQVSEPAEPFFNSMQGFRPWTAYSSGREQGGILIIMLRVVIYHLH